VGGERRHGEKADLCAYDPETAVLLESYIRLGVKNNPKLYPKWFRPVVSELFEQQKDFYYALLAHSGLHEGDLAERIKAWNFPGVKPEEIDNWETKRSPSDEIVDAVTPEKAAAAFDVLCFFSDESTLDVDTAELIKRFNPQSEDAARWHNGMLDYLNNGVSLSALLLRRSLPNSYNYGRIL
jgi:hypothetical protein